MCNADVTPGTGLKTNVLVNTGSSCMLFVLMPFS